MTAAASFFLQATWAEELLCIAFWQLDVRLLRDWRFQDFHSG